MLKLSQLNMNYVDHKLTGRQFEFYVADLIRLAGYRTKVTPAVHDRGIDVIFDDTDKYNERVGIQVKHYNTANVGYLAEEETVTGISYYGLGEGIIFTNSYFTNEAKNSAKKLNITLWDRNGLKEFIRFARKRITTRALKNIGLSNQSLSDMQLLMKKMELKSYQSLIHRMINDSKAKYLNLNKAHTAPSKVHKSVTKQVRPNTQSIKSNAVTFIPIPKKYRKYNHVYKSVRVGLGSLAKICGIQGVTGLSSRTQAIRLVMDNYIKTHYNKNERKLLRVLEDKFVKQYS